MVLDAAENHFWWTNWCRSSAAIVSDMEHGGWCPKGRLAEDGMIPWHYDLMETQTPYYAERNRKNVEDSDGTLIIVASNTASLMGGSLLTAEYAKQSNKSFLEPVPKEIVRYEQ